VEVTEGVTPPVIGSNAFWGVLIDGDWLIAGPHLLCSYAGMCVSPSHSDYMIVAWQFIARNSVRR
jgi:hypothetical protein